ncbi:MAG: hypothetical protein NWE93_03790 [Candidatus Bathyarchaeota archaeon]|nr:hypothetical protein [Candidatus Bathyarchaeota archaeon]
MGLSFKGYLLFAGLALLFLGGYVAFSASNMPTHFDAPPNLTNPAVALLAGSLTAVVGAFAAVHILHFDSKKKPL